MPRQNHARRSVVIPRPAIRLSIRGAQGVPAEETWAQDLAAVARSCTCACTCSLKHARLSPHPCYTHTEPDKADGQRKTLTNAVAVYVPWQRARGVSRHGAPECGFSRWLAIPWLLRRQHLDSEVKIRSSTRGVYTHKNKTEPACMAVSSSGTMRTRYRQERSPSTRTRYVRRTPPVRQDCYP